MSRVRLLLLFDRSYALPEPTWSVSERKFFSATIPTLLMPEFDMFDSTKSTSLYFPPIGMLAVVLEDASSAICFSSVPAKINPKTSLLLI